MPLRAGPRGAPDDADVRPPTEYEVKAAFLYHFAQLTEWPAQALPPGRPFVVAILGPDPFGATALATFAGKTAHERRIEVKRYSSLAQISRPPHILFVAASLTSGLGRILERFRTDAVLVVSDREAAPALVAFRVTADHNVRFDINLRECQTRRLAISSQVLKLARIVDEPEGVP